MPRIAARHLNGRTGRRVEVHVEAYVLIEGKTVISYDDPAEALSDAAEFLQEALDAYRASQRELANGQTEDHPKEDDNAAQPRPQDSPVP